MKMRYSSAFLPQYMIEDVTTLQNHYNGYFNPQMIEIARRRPQFIIECLRNVAYR